MLNINVKKIRLKNSKVSIFVVCYFICISSSVPLPEKPNTLEIDNLNKTSFKDNTNKDQSAVNSHPIVLSEHSDLENLKVDDNENEVSSSSSLSFQKERSNNGLIKRSDSLALASSTSATPLMSSVTNLFDTFRTSFRNILLTGQRGLIQAIGLVDKTVGNVQDGLQNSTYTLVLEGQKVSAKLYDLTPTRVNHWIQRIGTTRDNRLFQQVDQGYNQYKDNRNKWYDAWHEHEYHFHNHFQDNVWPSINHNLKVPELPRTQLGW